MSKQNKRNKMSGLRLKGGIYQIQKHFKHLKGGWLGESTKTSCRSEAESYLIRRLAEIEEAAGRAKENVYLFEEAGLRYLEYIAHKPSAEKWQSILTSYCPLSAIYHWSKCMKGLLRHLLIMNWRVDLRLSRSITL